MTSQIAVHDGLYKLAQIGTATGVQLVRTVQVQQANRYLVRPVEFDGGGQTQFAETETLSVTNLAEPADSTGQLPAGTDAVAIDVEGRWVVFVRPPIFMAQFPAKVVTSLGDAAYTVREQTLDAEGDFIDRTGVSNVNAKNLAELSLGSGAAVDQDAIVLVTALYDDDTPANLYYTFDHPIYSKYLD